MKLPTKVFFGVSVVKLESSAAWRPSESLATACTVYFVDAARWVDGVHEAPPSVIFPAIVPPLAVLTSTCVNLPLVALTLSAPLVSTEVAPSFGAMATTATDCLLCALSAPLPLASPEPDPEPEPPPPHAVTVRSRAPSISAGTPLALRPRASTDAPDIGRTFKSFSPPGPGRAPPQCASPAHSRILTGGF